MKKLLALAVAASVLTGCNNSIGVGASSEEKSAIANQQSVEKSTSLTAQKAKTFTVNLPAIHIILDAAKSYKLKTKIDDGAVNNFICSMYRSPELDRIELRKVARESAPAEKDFISFVHSANDKKLAATCATYLVSAIHAPTTGWPFWPSKNMEKAKTLMKGFTNIAIAAETTYNNIAQQLAQSGDLSEEDTRKKAEELWLESGVDFMKKLDSENENERTFTIDMTGKSGGMHWISSDGYDYEQAAAGVLLIKSGVPMLGGTMIGGKDFMLAVTRANSAALAQSESSAASTSTTSGSGNSASVGVQ
jgi:hypothetical protein